MPEVRIHQGELPSPIAVLEEYFWEPRVSLIQAAFANSFFVNPETVRNNIVWFPNSARTSNEHYPNLVRGNSGIWRENGREVRLYDNGRAQTAWARYSGRPLERRSGYGVRHIWGHPWDPDAFTAGWNLCYMPFWAGMLTEDQQPHEQLRQTIQAAAWFLFFEQNPVCNPPGFVENPGSDLDDILAGQPILVLGALGNGAAARIQSPERNADYVETIWDIRRLSRQSWINIVKAARSLQNLEHEPFGTRNVANTARACVRRMHRETGLSFGALEAFAENPVREMS